MRSEYLKHYEDLIFAYNKIFHLKESDIFEEIWNIIAKILIKKYNVKIIALVNHLDSSMSYNYRSVKFYAKIINHIFAIYSNSEINERYCSSFSEFYGFKFVKNNANILQIDLNSIQFPKQNEMHFFIMYDQIDKFKEYIVNNTFVDTIEIFPHYRLTPLEASAYYGSVNVFNFLLSNFGQKISTNCLNFALISGNTDIINECLKVQKIDRSLLRDILLSHNDEFLEYIFDHDLFKPEDFDIEDILSSQNIKAVIFMFEKDKNSIFPWCAAFPRILEILKNEKVDYTKLTSRRQTCFHFAARFNALDNCKFLLALHQIDINARDMINETALHIASYNNNVEIVKFLLSNGADVDVKNISGESPLHCASRDNFNYIVEILLLHHAKMDICDGKCRTPLHCEAAYNSIDTAKVLISNGAQINEKDCYQKTPLHLAAEKNYKQMVEFLVSHGAITTLMDKDGKTALQYALECKDKDTAEFLIDYALQINNDEKFGKE